MNNVMVATAMLATAEQPLLGPYPTKITGDLSHGYKMTLIVDAAGKRTLEFTPPTEPKEIP
jgi:hypothetical protein